jgi:hypothetical protein
MENGITKIIRTANALGERSYSSVAGVRTREKSPFSGFSLVASEILAAELEPSLILEKKPSPAPLLLKAAPEPFIIIHAFPPALFP